MNPGAQLRYRFATRAQWAAGLVLSADNAAFDTLGGIAPTAAYGSPGRLFPSAGAGAPASASSGRVLWRDDGGRLYLLGRGDQAPMSMAGPEGLAGARRMVLTGDNLWLAGTSPSMMLCYDSMHLARRFEVDLGPALVLDFASDRRGGVWILACDGAAPVCVHVDCAGRERARFAPKGADDATHIAWLRGARRLVLLAGSGKRLHWFAAGTVKARQVIDLGQLRPGFRAHILGSDGRSRLVVAGMDECGPRAGARVLCLDGDGSALDAVPLPSPATGIDASQDCLLVTTGAGLLAFKAGHGAGGDTGETSCTFVTPPLHSPPNENPRRWLRIEAQVTLPPGSSLEISFAASADPDTYQRAARALAAPGAAPSERLARLHQELAPWQTPMVFKADTRQDGKPLAVAVPLFDTHAPWLWVRATLVAAPGAARPVLHRMDVLYPGKSLMEQLPALYQRAEAEPGNFLRALVGVLETSTQELDLRIASMGELIDPHSAPADWLNFVARWLGLPWHDALDSGQKRRLLGSAAAFSARRGTRAGLETLLDALLPGTPKRYRIQDAGVEHGFALVGGKHCAGSTLPVLLSGLPRTALALNRKAILGLGRLPCKERPQDEVSRLAGHVTVDITADAMERRAWQPWLEELLGAAMPVTAHLSLRWRSPAARLLSDRLDGSLILADSPPALLGSMAVLGMARLPPGRGRALGEAGVEIGLRLR